MTGRRPQDDVFDARVFDALRLAEADPEEAAKVLLLVAEYLRSGQRMPSQLAVFVADAFEAAMSQPQDLRAKALTDWLYLSAKNKRRAKIDWLDAYEIVRRMPEATSNAQAEALVAHSNSVAKKLKNDSWSIGKTKADELIKEAKAYIEKEKTTRIQ